MQFFAHVHNSSCYDYFLLFSCSFFFGSSGVFFSFLLQLAFLFFFFLAIYIYIYRRSQPSFLHWKEEKGRISEFINLAALIHKYCKG